MLASKSFFPEAKYGLPTRPFRAPYVDDIREETEKFSRLLSQSKHLLVRPQDPPPKLDLSDIVKDKPDLILIDYVLWSGKFGGETISYFGGTLATRIREAYKDYPVILVSRKSRFRRHGEGEGQLGAIDAVIFKDEIEENSLSVIRSLIGWIQGFEKLRRVKTRNWSSLVRTLDANATESEKLKEALPSSSKDLFRIRFTEVEWSVPEAARWIYRVLFRYPGILYDSLHAATSLGISENSFQHPKVQSIFAAAKYRGVFASLSDRWWRDRILTSAFRLIRRAKLEQVLRTSFAAAFEKIHKVRLRPSRCIVTGREHADTVCYILRKPVLHEMTLEYFPDDRPRVMDPARVSFKAIIESPEVRYELLSAEGRRQAKRILRGSRG